MRFFSSVKYRLFKYALYSFLPFIRYKRKIQNNSDLVILCYHRVRDKTGIFYDRNISASPEEFRKQMLYIKKHFYPVSLDEIINSYMGDWKLKPNSILITFDDGFKDNVLNVFPVLEELGIPAIVFVITGFINKDSVQWEDRLSYAFQIIPEVKVKISDEEVYSLKSNENRDNPIWQFCKKLRCVKPDKRNEIIKDLYEKYQIDEDEFKQMAYTNSLGYLTKDDIQYWSNRGIDFGTHTINHPSFAKLSEEEMYLEVYESKRALECILEKQVSVFAYPYGKASDFNETSKSILKRAGIDVGFTFIHGKNNSYTDIYGLHRMGIGSDIDFKIACHGYSIS